MKKAIAGMGKFSGACVCFFIGYKFWSPEYAIKNTRKRKQQPLVDPPNLIDWKYILQYILGSHNINLTTKLVAFTDFEKIVKFRYLLKGKVLPWFALAVFYIVLISSVQHNIWQYLYGYALHTCTQINSSHNN